MIDRDEFSAWLRLLETPGVGRESARALLARFGSPDAAIGASVAARKAIVASAPAAALAKVPEHFESRLAAAWQWLTSGAEARDVIVVGDSRYPQALLASADPPLLLYARGRAELLNEPAIAVVGSRNPTPQGLENARAFASHLGRSGWVVVSGLALGIDGAAHEAALASGAGTIAVVGTGLDVVYPLRHRALTHKIASDGLIVSEFAVGTPALAENFPVRNRIIAGLARGTLVVEAAVQSGSLITARLAVEAGRDVFAIPGSIHSPQSRGCHALIQQGAKLVDSAADIVDELAPVSGRAASRGTAEADPAGDGDEGATSTSREKDAVLDALGFDPLGLDDLVARTGRSAADLSARLLDLELQGRVARLPGQRFQRIDRA
jgi:DNA processing protein